MLYKYIFVGQLMTDSLDFAPEKGYDTDKNNEANGQRGQNRTRTNNPTKSGTGARMV